MKKVNAKNTASPAYAKILRTIEKEGICPFCWKNFLIHHTRPIIAKGRHWLLTENFNPYPGTTHHLLVVSKHHVAHFKDLPPAAHKELFAILAPELERRKIRGGGLFMRFGDGDYTMSSVGHLHAQLIVGVRRGKNTELLLAPLGFKKKQKGS
jgi:diadenosine tetraphosphate (Ap4A) HIT family hydrolase